jgi:NADH-quinone oxidoreductase subunit C
MSQPKAPQPQAAPPGPPAPSAATSSRAQPKPEPIRAKELACRVTEAFPEVKVDYVRERRLKISTTPSRIKDIALFVRDQLGFDHISTVSGVDWMSRNELEVVYFVGAVSKPGYEDFIIALAERMARDDPVVPTLIDVWLGVDYHERETREMFGINFQGHPSSAHLILPEDWNDMPPLRKDYVSPGR